MDYFCVCAETKLRTRCLFFLFFCEEVSNSKWYFVFYGLSKSKYYATRQILTSQISFSKLTMLFWRPYDVNNVQKTLNWRPNNVLCVNKDCFLVVGWCEQWAENYLRQQFAIAGKPILTILGRKKKLVQTNK